jgi:hypothetical protein
MLKMTPNDFYNSTFSEIDMLLSEYNKYSRLDKLDQAYYNSCLIMNEKHNNVYNDIRSNILGVNNVDKLKTDIKRYKMISERFGIKYPGERVK